jgi:hypothetical protein
MVQMFTEPLLISISTVPWDKLYVSARATYTGSKPLLLLSVVQSALSSSVVALMSSVSVSMATLKSVSDGKQIPLPVSSVAEIVRLFETIFPLRLSFLTQKWAEMDYPFVLREIGDNDDCPGELTLRFCRSSNASEVYCAKVCTGHMCAEEQWVLDHRPVFFQLKSFGMASAV